MKLGSFRVNDHRILGVKLGLLTLIGHGLGNFLAPSLRKAFNCGTPRFFFFSSSSSKRIGNAGADRFG